jgi:hypothetical protein
LLTDKEWTGRKKEEIITVMEPHEAALMEAAVVKAATIEEPAVIEASVVKTTITKTTIIEEPAIVETPAFETPAFDAAVIETIEAPVVERTVFEMPIIEVLPATATTSTALMRSTTTADITVLCRNQGGAGCHQGRAHQNHFESDHKHPSLILNTPGPIRVLCAFRLGLEW